MYNKEWYLANKEKIKQQQKEYYNRNKEKRKEYRKKYYQEHKEQAKKWKHSANTEFSKEYRKQYYQQNKDKWERYRENLSEEQKENRKATIRALKKRYGHSHKAELIIRKGSKCEHCGIEYDGTNGAIFDFHHLNPDEKDFNITTYLRHYSKIPEELYKEVDKCILLCSNCHRLAHSDEY